MKMALSEVKSTWVSWTSRCYCQRLNQPEWVRHEDGILKGQTNLSKIDMKMAFSKVKPTWVSWTWRWHSQRSNQPEWVRHEDGILKGQTNLSKIDMKMAFSKVKPTWVSWTWRWHCPDWWWTLQLPVRRSSYTSMYFSVILGDYSF